MGFIGHGGDFAYPVRDADRMNGLRRAQSRKGAIVIAGAIAEWCPRRSKQASGTNRRSGSTTGASSSGSRMDIEPARVGSPGLQERKISDEPRPATKGRAVVNSSFASASRRMSVSGSSRSGWKAETISGRQRPARRKPSSTRRRPKAARSSGSIRPRRARASRRRTAFRSAWVKDKGQFPIRERRQWREARSRDGRWTVIPGAYASRWEPYAKAHEPRQGQPPWGSYGPEEYCPDAPPSSAWMI